MPIYSRASSMDGLQLRIRSVYERHSSPENHTGTFVIPATIIWMVVSGEKQIERQGVRYVLKRGDLVVFSPQDIISFGWTTEPFHFFTIAFHASVGAFHLPRLLSIPFRTEIVENQEETLRRLTSKWRELIHQLDVFVEKVNHPGPDPASTSPGPDHIPAQLNTVQSIRYMRVHAHLTDLISEVLEVLGETDTMPAHPIPIDQRVQDICLYVQNHLTDELTSSALAKRAFVSEGHFRYLFRETLGISPSDYIRHVRIQKAQELLQSSSLSIKCIADATGFADYRKFSRVFKKENGMSPMDYRRKVSQLEI